MLILSDALSVVAILAAGGYLRALNTEGQYLTNPDPDQGPPFIPSLVVAVLLILSGLGYYWWERRERKSASSAPLLQLILVFVLMIAATVGQVWIGRMLRYNAFPYQAYDSLVTLLTWYSAAHFLLAALIGLLLVVRMLRHRLTGHAYIVEVVGWWWYYTVISGLLMWLYGMVIK
jgi:uncharacterized membrane protein